MRRQFKDTVTDLAVQDEQVLVIVGDISGFLFKDFQQRFPDRFFNMGICESTLLTVTAGLSSQGFFPFVHTIAPFLIERGFEQIKLDFCYNQFGGNIVTCGSSFDYAWDGATHHCSTDLALLRLLPGIEVIQPGSRKETDRLLRSQYNNGRATYFKLSDHPHSLDLPVEFGKGVILKNSNSHVTVVTAGPILGNVFEACGDLPVNLIYFHTLKPLDKDLLLSFKETKLLVIHDSFGLYEAVHEIPYLSATYYGLPDHFIGCYGTVHDIRKYLGLDVPTLRETVRKLLH